MDLLAQATAELYEADPEDFTQRRQDLVGHAREAGEPGIAKQIAALRKPTRSAWVVNRLARTHPEAAERLAGLAAELRTGTRIRELTQARSALIDELTRQALDEAGLGNPPAALREDVIATLGAALADPEVAANLAAGTLVRAAHWAGFGLIDLAPDALPPAAPSPAALSPAAPSSAAPSPRPARPKVRPEPAAPPPDKINMAERAVLHATSQAEAAAEEERQVEVTVRNLEADLEQARERLALARRASYQAESRRRKAAAELDRIRK
jgi:hypothetical protein